MCAFKNPVLGFINFDKLSVWQTVESRAYVTTNSVLTKTCLPVDSCSTDWKAHVGVSHVAQKQTVDHVDFLFIVYLFVVLLIPGCTRVVGHGWRRWPRRGSWTQTNKQTTTNQSIKTSSDDFLLAEIPCGCKTAVRSSINFTGHAAPQILEMVVSVGNTRTANRCQETPPFEMARTPPCAVAFWRTCFLRLPVVQSGAPFGSSLSSFPNICWTKIIKHSARSKRELFPSNFDLERRTTDPNLIFFD